MVFENTKLCLILFMVAALIYLLNNKNDKMETTCDDNEIENFEDVLDHVIESDNTPKNKQKNDHIQKWEDEFQYKDADQENILPQGSKDELYADFTSDGKNHKNNLTSFDSADLLPNPDKEQPDDNGWTYKHGANWDESNPQIAQVDGNAWLNERKFLGNYTTGSSLRNATHDFRKDVPNPQMVVSPWNNTTILPDSNSKGLCTL